MKKHLAIIGLQWGDEGKGKIVDYFSDKFDVTVRFQGGHNAGHTVVVGENKIVLHLLPSGILHRKTICIIGNGVVFSPKAFLDELETIKSYGVEIKGRLFISKDAHLILPYHTQIDSLIEEIKGKNRIGTTKKGIGPTYEDKYGRRGIKVSALLYPQILKEEIEKTVFYKNLLLKALGEREINEKDIYNEIISLRDEIIPYIEDTVWLSNRLLSEGKTFLFESAQGTLLDIDFGTYPYVSSSHPTVGGIFEGLGVPHTIELDVLGIMKAYTTRVGKGPFPTELNDETGEILRETGKEYGATTGRPRRCGWLDLFATKYSAKINGVKKIAIMKLDVLDKIKTVKAAVGYKYKGDKLKVFPREYWVLNEVEPKYIEFKGWSKKTYRKRKKTDLPKEALNYLNFIEEYLEAEISIISTGPERNETIHL